MGRGRCGGKGDAAAAVEHRDDCAGERGGIGMAEDGNVVPLAAGMARAEDGVVAKRFEFCGDGGADFTGAEDEMFMGRAFRVRSTEPEAA